MSVDELAKKLPTLTSLIDIRSLFVSFYIERGVMAMVYYQTPPRGAKDRRTIIPVVTEGVPAGWVEYYNKHQLRRYDPIPRIAAASAVPFWFSDLNDRKDLNAAERRFADNIDYQKISDGLVVPLFGQFRRNGYACFAYDKNTPRPSASEVNILHWSAQIGHARTCELLNEYWTDPVKVSAREHQILGFIAAGRANPDIATKLGISTNTVDTYVRRLFTKLDVCDRVSATLRGLALGLIE